MAATVPLSFFIDPQHHSHLKSHQSLPFPPSITKPQYPLFPFHKSRRFHFKFSRSSSSDSSPSSSSSTVTASTSSYVQDPVKPGRFLTNEELVKLQFIENFSYFQKLESGSMWVRAMKTDEIDVTVKLLAESFAESMMLPMAYVNLLEFLVKQYLIERRTAMPHAVTLLGFYRGNESDEDDEELAGTVEVCFDKRGSNASPPTPTPPRNSPYICNMTVNKPLRRRGIGWHLLKASEELISLMSPSKEVYLHCRMIDEAPFNMYTKAGYSVVKTDSILILLTLQRRKHLMCKKLPVSSISSESDDSVSDVEIPSASGT